MVFWLLGLAICIFFFVASRKKARSDFPSQIPSHLADIEEWLRTEGYEVLSVCPSLELRVDHDVVSERETIECDFIVRKYGMEYAVLIIHDEDDLSDFDRLEHFQIISMFHVRALLLIDSFTGQIQCIQYRKTMHWHEKRRVFINRGLWFAGGLLFAIALVHRG